MSGQSLNEREALALNNPPPQPRRHVITASHPMVDHGTVTEDGITLGWCVFGTNIDNGKGRALFHWSVAHGDATTQASGYRSDWGDARSYAKRAGRKLAKRIAKDLSDG